MSQAFACHVMHYRSEVDGVSQPVVVSSPSSLARGTRLACIVYLLDRLDPPTRDRFIDSALREAHRWQPALEACSSPVAFLLSMGRAANEWVGLGGRELFDALEHAQSELGVIFDPVYLAGVGTGATGALSLACWFPDRWRAIAVAGARVDDRLDGTTGTDAPHDWEESTLSGLRPAELLSNLAGLSLWVEQPWWHDGLAGTTNPRQYEELTKRLKNHSPPVVTRRDLPFMLQATHWPADPGELLGWFLNSPEQVGTDRSFKTFSTRAVGAGVQVRTFAQVGKPATVRRRRREDAVSIQTTNAREIALQAEGTLPFRIDRRRYTNANSSSADHSATSWFGFQHRGDRWVALGAAAEPSGTSSYDSMWDLRWESVAFVPGTLGDDLQTRLLHRVAHALRDAWSQGAGDGPADIEFALVPDVDVNESLVRDRHLVLIGEPRTHLLLAKYHGRLACDWPATPSEEESESVSITPFRFRDVVYSSPDTGLICLGPHPETSGRSIVLVTATDPAGLARAARFRLPLLPGHILFQGGEIVSSGPVVASQT